jgi:hypothetical protein
LLLNLLDDVVSMARGLKQHPDRHQALKREQLKIFTKSLQDHGCELGEAEIAQSLSMDLELNAQGIAIWLDTGR